MSHDANTRSDFLKSKPIRPRRRNWFFPRENRKINDGVEASTAHLLNPQHVLVKAWERNTPLSESSCNVCCKKPMFDFLIHQCLKGCFESAQEHLHTCMRRSRGKIHPLQLQFFG